MLDCGGYTIKLATRLLGNDVNLVHHILNYKDEFEVDIYGSGTIVNDKGVVAQLAFGMDNSYKCELEVWGEKGTLYTNRILTAPDGFNPVVTINTSEGVYQETLDSDDTFKKSIEYFINCINNDNLKKKAFEGMLVQSRLVEIFKEN